MSADPDVSDPPTSVRTPFDAKLAVEAARTPVVSPRRAFVVLGGAVFLAMLPVTLIVPVLKELLVDRYGASTFWTHSFMSINLIGAILASPLIAAACDRRVPRSRTITAALVL